MTDALPLVSIVTPSFQQGEFLAENLRSIRQQSYPHIEHIVRDGGSTDGTIELLRSSPDALWVSQSDRGQTDALNQGFAAAKGEIFGWVNADDYLYPDAVRRAVETLQACGADAVYGRCLLVDHKARKIGFYRSEPFSYPRLLIRNIIAQPALFFTRRLYERFGPLDETLDFAMDYEYWLRCSRESRFVYVPELFAAYRIHAAGKTSSASAKHAAEANLLRRRYGPAVVPIWQLRLVSFLTYVGGAVKSSSLGLGLVRRLRWRRARE